MAGLEELDEEENEWWSPSSCFVEFEKREEFDIEELRVEGLSDESWLLGVDFGDGDGDGCIYGWKVLAIVHLFCCRRCGSLPSFKLVWSRGYCQECYRNFALFDQFLSKFLTYVLLSYFVHLHCANIHIHLHSFSFLMTSQTSQITR